ncbi:hypothetical protein CDL15_Pgr022283 [Punica granatum]|uniref:Uncharacterized protein n=1 Tax=Punica granatum TaxID=22663 RepID=A0A218WPU0_PUNGR|nr:hypothetical protein CDL15_Pgr022283 [Punica granatum]
MPFIRHLFVDEEAATAMDISASDLRGRSCQGRPGGRSGPPPPPRFGCRVFPLPSSDQLSSSPIGYAGGSGGSPSRLFDGAVCLKWFGRTADSFQPALVWPMQPHGCPSASAPPPSRPTKPPPSKGCDF